MWKLIRRILIGIAAILVLTIALSTLYVGRGGAFRTIDPHFAGTCTPFDLEGSAEDIQMDRERGYAYLSVYDRLGVAQGRTPGDGSILRLDLNTNPPTLSNALLSTPDHLHPHGLSLHIDAAGQRHLFMINHPEDRENGVQVIELFRESGPGQYVHVESFTHPDITKPNDLVAVGPRQVYVANDTGASSQFERAQERLIGRGFSRLVYLDGNNGTVVVDDIASGGGINASPDGSRI
jgi:arylesterase/paraoxonase